MKGLNSQVKVEKKINWMSVIIGLGLLAATGIAATVVENEKLQTTILDCFKIMFAAFIGIFGFEKATEESKKK
jgi:hypothetical protein